MIKMILKRLTRDFVDLLLLITVLSVLIKTFIENKITDQIGILMIFFGSLLSLYAFGTMMRMGSAMETMNEYIEDDNVRRSLGLRPYAFRDAPYKKEWQSWVFFCIWMALLTVYIVL